MDVARITRVIKQTLGPKWSLKSNRISVLASCLANGHCFTEAGATAIGVPACPWTNAYEVALRKRLMSTIKARDQIFNSRFTSISCQSFLALPPTEQGSAVESFVHVVRRCSIVAREAAAAARARKGGQLDKFYEDIGHIHMPCRGYTMHLAQCLWAHGLGLEDVGIKEGLFPPDSVTQTFHSCGSGTCRGIAQLTCDDVATLEGSCEMQRLRLDAISEVVGSAWKDFGKRVADPYGGLEAGKRPGYIGTQLCEWQKASLDPIDIFQIC
jgi:hypothetical protein